MSFVISIPAIVVSMIKVSYLLEEELLVWQGGRECGNSADGVELKLGI